MKKENRTIIYDKKIRIEAFKFGGFVHPFPNHFHEHYVIGFVEYGKRCLSCKNQDYSIGQGNIVIFNPGDNHSCKPTDKSTLNYLGFNISKELMLDLAEELTEKRELPRFSKNVIYDKEINFYIYRLHEMVMNNNKLFEKEEKLLLLIYNLLKKYSESYENCVFKYQKEIEKACRFIEKHFSERIYLEQICTQAGLNKSTLLRAFIKEKGITPYRYLENIRINEAKKLLSKGISPIDTAIKTGFFDQSHFTNCFTDFIGITPGTYYKIFR